LTRPFAGRRGIIRAPNHLGDVVAALPAIREAGADVMVVRWLVPVVEMAGIAARILPLDRGPAGWMRAARTLRREAYEEGALLTPSFSAAWLFRSGGVRRLRGTATDARGWMLSARVPVSDLRGLHRVHGYRKLLGLPVPAESPTPARIRADGPRRARWSARLRAEGRPLVGFFPGANAPARRWPVSDFATVAASASASGCRVVVLGGASERALTATVALAAPDGVDLGGETDLADAAAVLELCDALVTNDTGPMHLAAALGTPTVTLWGPSDRAEVRPLGAVDLPVTGPDLPCKPCYRNRCPRRGPGTYVPEAHEECMRSIEPQAVTAALVELLER
jgi:lipopolysaccharide heptosyltransferase II